MLILQTQSLALRYVQEKPFSAQSLQISLNLLLRLPISDIHGGVMTLAVICGASMIMRCIFAGCSLEYFLPSTAFTAHKGVLYIKRPGIIRQKLPESQAHGFPTEIGLIGLPVFTIKDWAADAWMYSVHWTAGGASDTYRQTGAQTIVLQ